MFRSIARMVAVALVLTWVSVARAEDPNIYFGNLHSHTSYSDGSGTPEQAYAHARDVAHLDFLAITEHNHAQAEEGAGPDRKDGLLIATDHTLYEGPQSSALIPTAARFTKDGQFIALYGQEFSSISKGNHVNVFEVSKVIDAPNGKFDELVTWLEQNHDSGGNVAIIQFNHPGENNKKDPNRSLEYGADDFGSKDKWIAAMGARACLIEVLNGPAMAKSAGNRSAEMMEDDYRLYLSLGFHVAPTGDQDNHYQTWGTVTDSRTGIIADALTKPKLLEAIRARHVYATEDKNLKILFKVNDHLCGDTIAAPADGSDLKIEYRIVDADEPDATYQIDVFAGTIGGALPSVVNTITADGNTAAGTWNTIDDVKYSGGPEFIFFRVTQGGDEAVDRAWTAPVWFQSDAQPVTPSPAGGGEDVSKFVASKHSSVYHLSAECKAAKMIKPENLVTGEAARQGRTLHQGCPQ